MKVHVKNKKCGHLSLWISLLRKTKKKGKRVPPEESIFRELSRPGQVCKGTGTQTFLFELMDFRRLLKRPAHEHVHKPRGMPMHRGRGEITPLLDLLVLRVPLHAASACMGNISQVLSKVFKKPTTFWEARRQPMECFTTSDSWPQYFSVMSDEGPSTMTRHMFWVPE
jgi:hypothetical protein